MTDQKWRSPNRHSIASDVTDKLPPRGEVRDDVSEALDMLCENSKLSKETCSVMRDIIERALAQQQTNEWQPIDTAPSDAVIMLYAPDRGIANEERIECRIFRNSKAGTQHAWATHWMPLPEPPSAEQKGQNHE